MSRSQRTLLPLLAAALLLFPSPAQASGVQGDDWESEMHAVYQAEDGTEVVLSVRWDTWSPWPVPFEGYEDRVRNVRAEAHLSEGRSVLFEDARIQFWFSHGFSLGVSGWVFLVRVEAEGLVWETYWAWELFDACYHNQVIGDLEDLRGATSVEGKALQPPAVVPTPYGPLAINGAGKSRKVGPGADGQFECWEGNGLS